jgi:uncharacterized protein
MLRAPAVKVARARRNCAGGEALRARDCMRRDWATCDLAARDLARHEFSGHTRDATVPKRVTVGVLVLCAVACNPAETARVQPSANGGATTPAASGTASSRGGSGTVSSAPPASRAAARCVVPLPQSPAPQLRPAESCPAAPGPGPSLRKGRVIFVEAESQPQVEVELALDDETRALGLMYRTEMPRGDGMLFSWDTEELRSFWMRNTCIPLDMLFIAGDGTIVGILEQVPTLNTLPRAVPCPAQHVLEVNAGWVRAHGVAPGQRVVFET